MRGGGEGGIHYVASKRTATKTTSATRVFSLAPFVQRLDKAFQRISRYRADTSKQNVLHYPPDRDFSSG